MVRFASVSAWVSVDDVPLPEFGEEVSHTDRKVTCWIPSETGKAFHIHWKHEDLYRNDCTTGWAYVDGKFVSGRILDPGNDTACVTGVTTSDVTVRPIMFTSLEMTDDEELLHSPTLSELGEINIEIWRVERLGRSSFQGKSFVEVGKIHERSKKAIAHCVKTGDDIALPKPATFSDVKKLSHLVTFIFKYRPLGMLQASDIAPAPEPTPASRKRAASPDDVIDISDDSDQEDNSSRIAKLEEELLQLKKRDTKRAKPGKRVKREVKLEPNITSGEVIDLT
ncbi:hypothetical protein EV421DRAFT_2039913 [Armillaria borealis]|uniref:DUF7918 domain-containing protein n=1 Tax=Armillaria borealis TaxID=47425 RepID=A0AA39J2D4_9AGAR|nr:hypothetical protein EV421DRAFT_2039913 [Armillaria borealis]